MPIVAAAGRATHVQELGAGPAVVMIHGLLIGSLASWYFTAAPQLARGHRVRVYDLRGHGRSERAASGYDTRTLAGDLDAVTADLREPFDLVGHSWGGLVALRYAIEHPARVRRLAIVEAPLPPSSALQMASFLADDGQLPARLLDALPAPLREAVASGRRQAERLMKSLELLVLESSLLADVRNEPDLADAELARVGTPALLLYGDSSACAPGGERLARALPAARHVVLPGGHYLHLDARDALARELEEFLA
ncbi:MAG TPA: alpha/beta hydrolase [Kofleriaceae bacterium]|nr:alpha/beta hydrolase [Kofleriaceae bacterium]